jgi:hypothetical protein
MSLLIPTFTRSHPNPTNNNNRIRQQNSLNSLPKIGRAFCDGELQRHRQAAKKSVAADDATADAQCGPAKRVQPHQRQRTRALVPLAHRPHPPRRQ